jgi:hypothetical protein
MNKTLWGIFLEVLSAVLIALSLSDISVAHWAFMTGAGPLRVMVLMALSAGTAFLLAVLNQISE